MGTLCLHLQSVVSRYFCMYINASLSCYFHAIHLHIKDAFQQASLWMQDINHISDEAVFAVYLIQMFQRL